MCQPQVNATPGMPVRQAVARRQARVREIMHTLPPAAQEAIRADLEGPHGQASHEPIKDSASRRDNDPESHRIHPARQ